MSEHRDASEGSADRKVIERLQAALDRGEVPHRDFAARAVRILLAREADRVATESHLRGMLERLRDERNAHVAATHLGALSERLEEENAATDARLVRQAMHE